MKKMLSRKMVAAGVLIIAFTLWSGLHQAWAQEPDSSPKAAEQKTQKPPELWEAYRLDFSISELEDGKRINTRQYSMNLNENDSNDLKIGSRVPVEGKQGEVQYIDVGTNIDARTQTRNGQMKLFVHAEMSNFAIPEQAQGHDPRPVIRQLKIGGSTVVVLGKPMVLGVVDDPNSKRQFQIEVTVTKLR